MDLDELEDFLEEAINDSLEMDWRPRDGARSILSALEAAGCQIVQGWLPIERALPPANEPVLMCWYHGHWETWEYEAGCYETGARIGDYSNVSRHGCATHWQPLPAPPAEKVQP